MAYFTILSPKKNNTSQKKCIYLHNKTSAMLPEQKQVIYPQNFDIKLIVSADIPIEDAKQRISDAFSESQTVHSFVNVRSSAKGNYITYTYNIDIDSKEHLDKTYALLRTLPGLKFAL